jgi:hypothetical protein
LSDNDLSNQNSNLLANTTGINHENSNASIALGQVNATHIQDSSQSNEETTKRMKGSTKKNKKHHKKHKKHKHKDQDAE